MSKTAHKGQIEAQANRNQNKLHTNVSHAIEQIDNTLKQLRERIIPPQPYLLSVPSDDPYRHSPRVFNTWYIGTPFTAAEEQLQYLSFRSHHGEEDSLLQVVGGWADEKGAFVEEDAPSPTASLSGRNTPVEQHNRKKISLKDYRIKDKTRPSTPTTKAPAEELRKQVMKSEAKERAAKVEEDVRSSKMSEKSNVKIDKRDNVKKARPQPDGTRSPPQLADPQRRDVPSPRKRRRLSTDDSKRDDAPAKVEKTREPEDTKELPSLLSPTLPERQRERKHKALPGLLLPDLPPALERLVAKSEGKFKIESSTGTKGEQVKSSATGNVPVGSAGKRLPEKQPGDTTTVRARSDSLTVNKATVGTPKGQSPALKASLKTVPRPATPLQNSVVASPMPPERGAIVLKYGKKNVKRVQMLLRFPPRPKKVKPPPDEPPSKPPEVRLNSAKPVLEPEKLERKRPANPSPERPVKKVKQLETPEKPKVSNISAAKSPAIMNGIKPKAELLTPKKELKSSAMRRMESQDGGDVRTPQGDRTRLSTPVNAGSSSQNKVSPGPSSSISKEDRASWVEMHSKCFALGRTLKHEGTSLVPSPGHERSDKDQALSVVLSIEALLCFMINHAAQSQARPTVDAGWSTILPYHIWVFRASRKYRHLHGLVIQLGAICRQAIHNFDIEQLARDPLPFEHGDSAPTPGSDGNTKQTDDAEKSRRKFLKFRDQLVQNARELSSAWLEGSRYLPPTLIERDYPKTWAKRTKDTSKRGMDKLKPSAIGREYFLPLDVSSTAFEATRFALSFLKEWSDKEKIDWKPRVEL